MYYFYDCFFLWMLCFHSLVAQQRIHGPILAAFSTRATWHTSFVPLTSSFCEEVTVIFVQLMELLDNSLHYQRSLWCETSVILAVGAVRLYPLFVAFFPLLQTGTMFMSFLSPPCPLPYLCGLDHDIGNNTAHTDVLSNIAIGSAHFIYRNIQ